MFSCRDLNRSLLGPACVPERLYALLQYLRAIGAGKCNMLASHSRTQNPVYFLVLCTPTTALIHRWAKSICLGLLHRWAKSICLGCSVQLSMPFKMRLQGRCTCILKVWGVRPIRTCISASCVRACARGCCCNNLEAANLFDLLLLLILLL